MACPDVKQFLEDLRSQEKVPFGVKLHKLNGLAKSVSNAVSSSEEKADAFLNSIQPSDFYTRRTQLELANALKRFGPILDVLKSDDQILLHRALQFKWIYSDEAYSPLLKDPEFLVRELSPQISYSSRIQIINKLGKYCPIEEKVDKIFESVERSYGIELAKKLLPSCSKATIQRVLSIRDIMLSCNQTIWLYNRHPDVAMEYLNHSFEEASNGNLMHSSFICSVGLFPVLRRICKDSPDKFMTLFEKYSKIMSGIQLGPKLSNHLIKHGKGAVIKSSRIYARLLQSTEVRKRLSSEEFSEFITNLFPPNIQGFQVALEVGMEGYRGYTGSLFSWLEKLPHDNRFPQLQQSFKKVYSKNILDFPEFMSTRVIQMLPPKEREIWIDLKLKSPDGQYLYQSTGHLPLHREGYWDAFRPCNKSIDKIKNYLHTEADVHRRADLLSSAVLSCFINNDKTALAEMCEYVVSRFRNDNSQVRLDFLEAIENHFDLLKLNESHWTHINELVQISSINNEFSHGCGIMVVILEKSIQYRLKKDLPIEAQVQHYIKMKTRGYCGGDSWRIITNEPTLEKKCLRIFIEQVGLMYPLTVQCSSDSAITSAFISLSESISSWNKRHNKDSFSCNEFSWLMTRLEEVLNSYHEPNKYRVISALKNDKDARSAFFPKLLKSCPLPPVLQFFLRHEPHLLDEHAASIVGFLVRSNKVQSWNGFLKKLRSQGIPSVCERMVNKCLEIAEDEDGSMKERCNAFNILSILLQTEHFIDWISKYNPQEGKVDPYSEEAGLAYEFRRAVSRCLSNIAVPPKGLKIVGHYCIGDYLKLIVGCLYSLANRSSSSIVLPFLKDLVNRPVSTKKHAIRLVLSFSCKCENIDFLKELWDSEKNHSIRHIIFNKIFELFLSDNSEDTWNLLESSIKSLTPDDHPFLNELGRTDFVLSPSMPADKLSMYLKLAWETVHSLGDRESAPDFKWVKASLLQCISPVNITDVSDSFIVEILEKNLFVLKEDPNLQSSLVQLAGNYLLYSKSTNKLDVIAKCMDRLTGTMAWNAQNKDFPATCPARQALSYFVEQLSIESFRTFGDSKKDESLTEVFAKILTNIKSVLDPCDFFTDYLFLEFSRIFHSQKVDEQTGGPELQAIGKKIGILVDSMTETYKSQIIEVISETLKRFLSLCYKYELVSDEGDGARVIWIIDGILSSTGSLDTQILASHLLLLSHSNHYKGHKLEDIYLNVLESLRNSKDKTVQIFVNYRLAQRGLIRSRGYDVLV